MIQGRKGHVGGRLNERESASTETLGKTLRRQQTSWTLTIARLLSAFLLTQSLPVLALGSGALQAGGADERLEDGPAAITRPSWRRGSRTVTEPTGTSEVFADATHADPLPEPSPGPPSVDLIGYGFAGKTTGGLGHTVIEVTNLRDSGATGEPLAGSLRAALSGGNRIVRFRVSGNIELRDRLTIRHPNITIDGSDAPNGGVALWGQTLNIEADNVVIRHLRFRGSHPTASVDGISIGGGSNILIDHISCSWATDECLSIYGYSYVGTGRVRNVTVQHSLFAEAPEGQHNKATLVSGDVSHVTWFRNVFAKNANRNPQIATGQRRGRNQAPGKRLSGIAEYELIQNVIYDAVYATRIWNQSPDWTIHIDAIGNLWKAGPRWPSPKVPIMVFAREKSLGPIRVFMRGNAGPRRTLPNPRSCDFFSLEAMNSPCGGYAPYHQASQRLIERHDYPDVTAKEDLQSILGEAGATRPCRDSLDQRIIDEVRTGGGSHVKGPGQLPNLDQTCR